jgi:hypothetical protein
MDATGDSTYDAYLYGVKRMLQTGAVPITVESLVSEWMHDRDQKTGELVREVYSCMSICLGFYEPAPTLREANTRLQKKGLHERLLGVVEMLLCRRCNLPSLRGAFEKTNLDQVRFIHILDRPDLLTD